MIRYFCNICGKEMGVWLEVRTSIGASHPLNNVSNMIEYNRYDNLQICEDCCKKITEFLGGTSNA